MDVVLSVTLPLIGFAKYCDVYRYVCVSVCSFAYPENHVAELHQIFVHVVHGRGLVLLWRSCDTLYTSGLCITYLFSFFTQWPYDTSFLFLNGLRIA